MIAGKVVVVCGYGDVGKGCSATVKRAGARAFVTEADPICDLQAVMEGIPVLTLDDNIVSEADIFVTATGNRNIITVNHMKKMKNNAIVCNIGQFDNEIDVQGLANYPGIKRVTIKPQTDRWIFPDSNRGVLVLAEGRSACELGMCHRASKSCHVLALMEPWKEKGSGKYEKNEVYLLPKHLDEKVARLHIDKLGGKLNYKAHSKASCLHWCSCCRSLQAFSL
ncbi:hypothetical protein ACSBR2_036322 [Camellia fascicularis]